MISSAFLQRLVPNLPPVGMKERARAALGALLGIGLTALITHFALGDTGNLPFLVAPIGASSVLLFAVPASPLAQPWSVFGGNLCAALVGVTVAKLVPDLFLASALAGAIAIFVMLCLRCLHPPSGAVALTAVLGGPAVIEAGYTFVAWPVAINTLIIIGVAIVFNNLTGKTYPHALPAPAPAAQQKPPSQRVGFTLDDIEAALDAYPTLLTVDPGDVEQVLKDAEARSLQRRLGEVRCGDIMSTKVRSTTAETPLSDAIAELAANHLKVLPVVDSDNRVVGILTQTDIVAKGVAAGATETRKVADVMTKPARSARADMSLADLVPLMADGGLHHLPVTDADEKLVGVITQSDVIGALMHERQKAG